VNRFDALNGALVADAAALGLHWMYDQQHLQLIEKTGDVLFRQPEAEVYRDRKAYFAHAPLRAGDLSHYGASARMLADVALSAEGYSRAAHAAAFLREFGPCGQYVGFADRPTKALTAVLLQAGEELPAQTGSDDSQMPPLAYAAGLLAAQYPQHLRDAVGLLSCHPIAFDGASCLLDCLQLIESGVAVKEALQQSAEKLQGELGEKLQHALQLSDDYRPLEVAVEFGLACQMLQGLPLVWYLAAHASDFETAVRDNVRCGGDSCGRAMALGAIAGLAFGVPDHMQKRARYCAYS